MKINNKCCCGCSATTNENASKVMKVMLIGNPNCGKSTLFNRLCHVHVRTGNYPGVTVSKNIGNYSDKIQIVDLPGIYSLTSATAEEKIASVELLHSNAELIINIADSSSLERSLYLTLELRMLGIPMVLLLNMWDTIKRKHITIDINKLSNILGIPVIPISASKGLGVDNVQKLLDQGSWDACPGKCFGSEKLQEALKLLSEIIPEDLKDRSLYINKSALQKDYVPEPLFKNPTYQNKVSEIRDSLAEGYSDIYEFFAQDRYMTISSILKECYSSESYVNSRAVTTSKIDKFVLNRYLAFPIFLLVMCLVYYIAISWLGSIATDWTNETLFSETIIPAVSSFMENRGSSQWITSLVSEGIVGGVGAVLGFVPQLIILFLLLSVLEECGYMTRASFILDRVFHIFGLSGRAFIPYLIASGCGVPALMTARTLGGENERRFILFTANMIPCGAKLPIIVVFAGALFSDYPLFAPAMYLMGLVIIIVSALIMKKFQTFKPSLAPLMLELPTYHLPNIKVVLNTVYQRSKAFIIKAGTIIFASVTFVWLLSHFSYTSDEGFKIVGDEDQELSIMADVAKPISEIFSPLGFNDYRAGVSVIMGLVAKENIVGTMALYSGSDNEEDPSFYTNLRDKVFGGNLLVALSFVIFNLFTIPCFASVGVIKRELGSIKLFLFAISYQLLVSYSLAMVIFQLSNYFINDIFTVWTGISWGLVAIVLYLLIIKRTARRNADSDISFRMIRNSRS